MKFPKRFVVLSALLLVTLMAGVLVASSQEATTEPMAEATAEGMMAQENFCTEEVREQLAGQEIYIPIVSKGFQHQFWQAVLAGAEQAAEDCGVEITFEGPESESQVDRQLEMLQTALDRGPDALVFAALDSQAAIPLLERAQEEDIPVIAFDSGVDSDIPVTTAATDNVAAAALAADMMAELIGGEGEVAIVAHDQTSRTGIDRVEGFTARIEEMYPDITIVDTQYGGGDQLRSTDITNAILLAHPDLRGIFGANEGSAIGVLNAVVEQGREGEIVVIGYDSGAQQIEAVRSGTMAGAITQNPVGIGYRAVEAAVMALLGEEVAANIDTGFFFYTSENIDDEEIAAVLYE